MSGNAVANGLINLLSNLLAPPKVEQGKKEYEKKEASNYSQLSNRVNTSINFHNQSTKNNTYNSQPGYSRQRTHQSSEQPRRGYYGPPKNHSSRQEQTVFVQQKVSQNSSNPRRHYHHDDNSRSNTFMKAKTENQGGQKNYSAGKNFNHNSKNYDNSNSQQKPFHKKPQNKDDNPGKCNRNPQNRTIIVNKTIIIHQNNNGNRNSGRNDQERNKVHHNK